MIKRLRLLIIDDDETVRRNVSMVFRNTGWELHEAASIQTLVTNGCEYDLVICDAAFAQGAEMDVFVGQLSKTLPRQGWS
jgi:DNA-binding NtrC family response regulator